MGRWKLSEQTGDDVQAMPQFIACPRSAETEPDGFRWVGDREGIAGDDADPGHSQLRRELAAAPPGRQLQPKMKTLAIGEKIGTIEALDRDPLARAGFRADRCQNRLRRSLLQPARGDGRRKRRRHADCRSNRPFEADGRRSVRRDQVGDAERRREALGKACYVKDEVRRERGQWGTGFAGNAP